MAREVPIWVGKTDDPLARVRDDVMTMTDADGASWVLASDYAESTARLERVAVAALEVAAEYHDERASDEDARSARYRGGSDPWFTHVQKARLHQDNAVAIRAIIADPTAIAEIVKGAQE